MLPEFINMAIEWLELANFKDKQGLRVIAAVVKHKGKKKFKTKPMSQLEDG